MPFSPSGNLVSAALSDGFILLQFFADKILEGDVVHTQIDNNAMLSMVSASAKTVLVLCTYKKL